MSNIEPNNSLGLDNQTYTNLKTLLANRESSNNQYCENTLGYLGKYQFGAPALTDTGFINQEKYKAAKKGKGWQKEFLADESNWNIPGGKQAFMSNVEYQEQAMDKLLAMNAKTLRKKIPDKVNTQQSLSSNLAAAHLGGAGSVIKYHATGDSFQDAYGTDIQEYMRLGAKSTSSQAIIPYTPSNRNNQNNTDNASNPTSSNSMGNISDPQTESIIKQDSKNNPTDSNQKPKEFFDGLLDNPIQSMLGLAFVGSIASTSYNKTKDYYNNTKDFLSGTKDKLSSLFNSNKEQNKQTNQERRDYQENQKNTNIFQSLISRIATSQEQLSSNIEQSSNTNILSKIYNVNKEILRVLENFVEQAYDEQDTRISSPTQQAAQTQQIVNNTIIQQSQQPSGGLLSNIFKNFLGSGTFWGSVAGIITGILGAGALKALKFLGKLPFKALKWALGLTAGKLLKVVWNSIKKSSMYKLIADTAEKLKSLTKFVWKIASKIGMTAFKLGATALKNAGKLGKLAKPVATFAGKVVQPVGSFLKEQAAKLGIKAKNLYDTVKQPIVNKISNISNNIKQNISSKFSNVSNNITNNKTNNIISKTSEISKPVKETSILDSIYNTIKKSKDYVVENAGKAWDYSTKKISLAYNYSKEAIQEGYKYTTTKFKELWGVLSESASKGWEKLKSKIPLNIIEEKIVPKMLSFLSPVGAKTFAAVIKKVPILGLVVGSGLAVSRALAGDYTGAALEFLSGLASIIPGPGTAASLAIDGALIYRDLNTTEAEAEQRVDDLKSEIEKSINQYNTDFSKTQYSNTTNNTSNISSANNKEYNIDRNATVNVNKPEIKQEINKNIEVNKETKILNKENEFNKMDASITIVNYGTKTPEPVNNINIVSTPQEQGGKLSSTFNY